MTFARLTDRINWRLLFIHALAYWFFIHAFQTFSYLNNTSLIHIFRQSNEAVALKTAFDSDITAVDLTNFLVCINTSGLLGLLAAFFISLIICYRRRWFWLNPVILLVIMYLLYHFDLLGWRYVRQFFWLIGQTIADAKWEFIINGTLLLTIGCLFFFHPRINNFMKNGIALPA